MKPEFICAFLVLSSTITSVCQISADSVLLQKSIAQTQSIYGRAMEGSHYIYNGSEYIEYQPIDDEHPYYLTDDWVLGKVNYSGQEFSQVPMMFDAQQGKVILSYYYNGTKMHLIDDWVDGFTMDGHRFINIKAADSSSLKPGYYEVLYDGNCKILARRSKRLVEKIEGIELIRFFEIVDEHFMRVNGKFYKISGKRDIVKTFGTHKKELKAYIRKNNLFDFEREQSAIQLAIYFDTLTP
jgi:hypothetical protein